MRAIPGTARHSGWELSMPVLEGLSAAASQAMALVARAVGAIQRWHLINRNIRELSRLDDHLLADIGLHRSEIVVSVYRRVAEIELSGRYPYR
jgi:uncharacterized protein YjiS (DUF1127 family)